VITVPSGFARRSFVQMGVSAEKLRKVPYGVDLQRFEKVGEPSGRMEIKKSMFLSIIVQAFMKAM
jgi:hypothetical protein